MIGAAIVLVLIFALVAAIVDVRRDAAMGRYDKPSREGLFVRLGWFPRLHGSQPPRWLLKLFGWTATAIIVILAWTWLQH